jgi:hypothetical protein
MSYQAFHQSDDKIEVVRDYYISQGRKEGKQEMPWWVGRKTILFPQVILGDYSEAALWLCTHRYLVSLNLRDLFSAGGQWKVLNGKLLDVPYPAVLGKWCCYEVNRRQIRFADLKVDVRDYLLNPDKYQLRHKL